MSAPAAAESPPPADSAAPPAAPIDRTALRRLLGLALPYRWALIGGGVGLIATSLLGLVIPWLVRGLIDGVVLAGGGAAVAAPRGRAGVARRGGEVAAVWRDGDGRGNGRLMAVGRG